MNNILRIHWHWTAGAPGINPKESDSYNFVLQWPHGEVVACVPVERQIPPLINGAYAAHTLNANSRAIGISMDGMAGAVERPFNPGKYPITEDQLQGLVRLTAMLNKKYGIKVSRDTNLFHSEVQRTLKIKQKNKWDCLWIPGMDKPGDAIEVGDRVRTMVQALM